jgi:hypothetical protein
LGLAWFVTGSVAASVHGVLRSSQDVDVVVDLDAADVTRLAATLGVTHAIAQPIAYGDFAMASVIDRRSAQKVDIILKRSSGFEASAFARRVRAAVPELGEVWVASVEDVILAKLAWSEGTSELQLRDCRELLRINAGLLDRAYLERWASELGLLERLRQVGDAT